MTSLLFVYKIQYKLAYIGTKSARNQMYQNTFDNIVYISLEIQDVVKRWTNIGLEGLLRCGLRRVGPTPGSKGRSRVDDEMLLKYFLHITRK